MKSFLRSRKFLYTSLCLLTLILIAYFYKEVSFPVKKNVKYVAYIGRYSNNADTIPYWKQPKNKFDLLHEVTIQKYLKELELPYT
ncbi:MAG: hypothetical protein H7259_09045, partial [Cytophagales bacterium]|nr:hypothetical protein [Cytophaga sp.]